MSHRPSHPGITRRSLLHIALGVPCVSPAAAQTGASPPIDVYGRLPAFDHLCLSPTGARLAFVAEVEGRRMLVARARTGSTRPIVQFDVTALRLLDLGWLDDDLLVGRAYSAQNLGGAFNYTVSQIFVVDAASGQVNWPLRQRRWIDAAFGHYGHRRIDGRWKTFVGAISKEVDGQGTAYVNAEAVTLVELDLRSGTVRALGATSRNFDGWVIGASGGVLASAFYDPAKRRWSLHQGRGGAERFAIDDPEGRSELARLGRHPQTVACWLPVDDAEASTALHEIDLTQPDRPPQRLELPEHAAAVWHDPDSHLLAGAFFGHATLWPHLFDADRARRLEAVRKSMPDHLLHFVSASRDTRHVAFFSTGLDDAGSWWVADVNEGRAEEVGWSYPGVRARDVAPWRTFRHRAADGLEIDGVLTLPPDHVQRRARCGGGLALVVLPHGGPESRDEPGFHWWPQALASRGYAVWQPNFRGSSGRGPALRRAGHGQWGRRMQTDLSDGVRALAAEGLVDARRACIVGASYGGYAALAGVTLQQGIYRCAVAVAPVSDLYLMLERATDRSGLGARQYLERYIGAALTDGDALRRLSPLQQASSAGAPVLLMHGLHDTVVPVVHSQRMANALRAAGKPVEFVVWEDEDHYLSLAASRQAMLAKTWAFLERHNPPC